MDFMRTLYSFLVVGSAPDAIIGTFPQIRGRKFTPMYCAADIWLYNSFSFFACVIFSIFYSYLILFDSSSTSSSFIPSNVMLVTHSVFLSFILKLHDSFSSIFNKSSVPRMRMSSTWSITAASCFHSWFWCIRQYASTVDCSIPNRPTWWSRYV